MKVKAPRWLIPVTLLALALALTLLTAPAAHADTLTVTSTDDGGPGSLRQAIVEAQPGDTIDFALSYPATITLTSGELAITKPLTIAGPGPDLLAVSGNRASRVFRVDNAGGVEQIAVTISGLTIRDGEAGDGGGLWNDERLTLTDVAVLNNLAQDEGGGLYNSGGSPTLTNVIFTGNAAQGIYPLGVHGGGGMYIGGGNPVLTNVAFSGNWANQAGGGINNNGDPTLINVTLSGNVADLGGGMYNAGSPAIHNSILWGNRATFGDQIYPSSSNPPAISHSDVEGSGGSGAGWDAALGTDLGGNLDTVPHFVEPVDAGAAPTAGGDLRLWRGSPLIDAGDNSLVPPGVTTDPDGVPRIAFGTVDMGSYEFQPGLYLDKGANEEGVEPGERVSYVFTVFNAFTDRTLTGGVVSDTLAVGLELAGPIEIDPPGAGVAGSAPPLLASDLTVDPGQSVTITVPVTVDDAMPLGIVANSASVSSTQVPTPQLAVHELLICLPHLTVTSDADGGPGSLREAIGHACPGATIDFALSYPATITLSTGELLIVRPLTIGGPGPELLAISGNDSGRVFRVDRPGGSEQIAVSLSGLTIRDANGDDGGGLWSDEALTLTEVAFRDNSAEAGAGIFNYRSSPALTDVTFQDNTLRWGGAGGGGGMYNYHGNPVLTRVLFSGNGGGGSPPYTIIVGGGMFNWHSSPRLTDVTFRRNSADAGGGIYNYENSSPVLTNVAFYGHSAGSGGAIFGVGGSLTLTNAVLSGNAAERGGGIQNSGVHATLTNVTLSGNRAWADGGAIWSSDSSLTIQNSILWGNEARGEGDQIYGYDTAVAIAHSDVGGSGGSGATWDGSLGTDLGGNLDVDPRFVDPVDPADAPTASGNLRLQEDSQVIDAGENSLVPPGVMVDLDGAPRIVCRTVDLGAYEFPRELCLDKRAGVERATAGQRITYTLTVFNSLTDTVMTDGVVSDSLLPGMVLASPVTLDPPGAGMVGTPPLLVTDLSLDPGQTVTVTLPVTVTRSVPVRVVVNTASAASAQVTQPSWAYHSLLVCIPHQTVTSSADGGPGSLRQAIAYACPGGTIDFSMAYPATILLSGGELTIAKPLTITGPGADLLAIGGNGTARVFRVAGPGGPESIAVTLSGLTLRDGYAEEGGGLWNDADLTLTSVVLSGNSAEDDGGGVYSSHSSPRLTNVVFYRNAAAWRGGGMYNDGGNPGLTNVTFYDNSADSGDGMYNQGGSPTIQNSILWGTGNQLGNGEGSTPTITHSDVQGSGGSGPGWDPSLGIDGGGSIDGDPLFLEPGAGNLRLAEGSPAVNAGANDLVPVGVTTDADGAPRIAFGLVDMGAYEVQPAARLYLPVVIKGRQP